ncbi:MAG: glycosyltransferase [Planctomycetes bacterium]|nr:glycosyltransferase [Planctomycetota bacterium]
MPDDYRNKEPGDRTQPVGTPAAQLALSLVIPAWNESRRIPAYLESVRGHFDPEFDGRYAVIVVDDGSTDEMPDMLADLRSSWPQLRVMRHEANRGKGAAIRTGMLAAAGPLMLFADADGATPIEEERRLRRAIEAGADVAIASRLVPDPRVTRRRTRLRALLGRAFASTARHVLRLQVLDTQCGFKMFTSAARDRVFPLAREDGFLLDLELLMLAQLTKLAVAEVPVNWAERAGSRMSIATELRRIAGGLWRLRRRQSTIDVGR